jgi:O-antigen/teichoic acid export membrane protein
VQQVSFEPPTQERPPPSLRANFRWTLAGNLVYSLCQWGMLSVLAKVGNASMVGQFALGLAISAPVFMFTNLALRAVQVTDGSREYRFADYFTLRLLTTTLGLLVVAILVFVSRYDPGTRGVILLLALAKFIECLSDVIGGLLQLHEHLDQAAVSLMIRGALSILAFSATFLSSHSLFASTAAMCVAWLGVFIGYDLRRAKDMLAPGEPYVHFVWQVERKLVLLALPLGFVTMLLSLNGNIPRYLLERFGGPAQLGIFASLAYVLLTVSTVVNALGQSAIVRLSSMFAAGDLDGFAGLIFKLVGMGVAATLVGLPLSALLGRTALTLLYRPEYGEHMRAFLIMVAAGGVGAVASFLGYGVTTARRFHAQIPVTAACTLTTVVVTTLLVPHHKLAGAAVGLLASAIVLAVGYALVLLVTIAKARKTQSMAGESATCARASRIANRDQIHTRSLGP